MSADAMRKVQAGLDLVTAGYRQLNIATGTAWRTMPDRPAWWPDVWHSKLEGQMRRYLAARGGPLGGNTYASEFQSILDGVP